MLNGLRQANSNDIKYPANCANRVVLDATHNGDNGPIDMKILDQLYEPKPDKKIVRIITVIAYCFSVSLGAILLSLYYLFLWDPYIKSHMRNQTTERPLVSFSGTREPPSEPRMMALQVAQDPTWLSSVPSWTTSWSQMSVPGAAQPSRHYSDSSLPSSSSSVAAAAAPSSSSFPFVSVKEALKKHQEKDDNPLVQHKFYKVEKAKERLEDPFTTYAKAHHMPGQAQSHRHERRKRSLATSSDGSSSLSLEDLITGKFIRMTS